MGQEQSLLQCDSIFWYYRLIVIWRKGSQLIDLWQLRAPVSPWFSCINLWYKSPERSLKGFGGRRGDTDLAAPVPVSRIWWQSLGSCPPPAVNNNKVTNRETGSSLGIFYLFLYKGHNIWTLSGIKMCEIRRNTPADKWQAWPALI